MSSPGFLLLLVFVCVSVVLADPLREERVPREIRSRPYDPVGHGSSLIAEATLGHVLFNAPRGARLIATQPPIPAIQYRLPDNYTLIRPNVVDNFRCDGRSYGYYADVENECQIFHVCLPLRQLYPANFTADITFQYSFICPEYTIFSQDVLVCAWEEEAVGCEYAEELYKYNNNFFRKIPKEDGTGEEYAKLNSPL